MKYFIIYKNEFIVLLNELSLPFQNELVLEREINNSKKEFANSLIERLKVLPQFDYAENLILVKCAEVSNKKLDIRNIKGFIPLTNKSFLAYNRKFSKWKFTDPKDLRIEESYKEYMKCRIAEEMKMSLDLFDEYIIDSGQTNLTEKVLQDLANAQIDKKLYGLTAINKEVDETKSFYYTLFLFQAGSEFDRSYPIGFLSQLITVYISHYKPIRNIKKLKDSNTIFKYLYREKKDSFNHFSIEGLYREMQKDNQIGPLLEKINEISDIEGDTIRIGLYTLYFRFLIESDFSILEIRNYFKLIYVEMDNDILTALKLNALYVGYSKIAEMFLPELSPLFSSSENDTIKRVEDIQPFLTDVIEKRELNKKLKIQQKSKPDSNIDSQQPQGKRKVATSDEKKPKSNETMASKQKQENDQLKGNSIPAKKIDKKTQTEIVDNQNGSGDEQNNVEREEERVNEKKNSEKGDLDPVFLKKIMNIEPGFKDIALNDFYQKHQKECIEKLNLYGVSDTENIDQIKKIIENETVDPENPNDSALDETWQDSYYTLIMDYSMKESKIPYDFDDEDWNNFDKYIALVEGDRESAIKKLLEIFEERR